MRVIDIIGSAVGLVLLAPVLLVAAVAVKLTSPGPVLYRAQRVGRGGRPFTMYKFRTMRADGAGARVTAGEADPRITRIGAVLRRHKLDELPQLLNVLRGEMALVGPRPEDPAFIPLYTPEELHVLDVRPGLTAPVQLAYRDLAERFMRPHEDPTEFYVTEVLHQRLAMDLAYVRSRSLWGDLRLIWLTVRHIAGLDRTHADTTDREAGEPAAQ